VAPEFQAYVFPQPVQKDGGKIKQHKLALHSLIFIQLSSFLRQILFGNAQQKIYVKEAESTVNTRFQPRNIPITHRALVRGFISSGQPIKLRE
jgi:hypothetical protein